jgi:hypothetical protein
MKVFISYGNAADQVTALRLQALGGASGLTVFVPPAYTRAPSQVLVEPEIQQRLSDADVVLGFIGSLGISRACNDELGIGRALGKNMIVMAHPPFDAVLEPSFGQSIVQIDPANPHESERFIVQHLNKLSASQNAKLALLALSTLALGLILLAPADSR